ncbi:MAG: 5'/3'-nucleotidase SurE [Dehalococcoidia bacterium]
MNIVVTNDDGLNTPGIWALAEALCQVGNVSVVAPDREQSGVGMAISYTHPVRVTEVISRIEGVKTLAVEGTPADSVILAVQGLTPEPVDLVVSGINAGANTGMNVMVSGTVGAAIQAHLWHIPAIAISVATPDEPVFEPSAQFARVLAEMFKDGALSGPVILNVNLPNIAAAEIESIDVTRLAKGAYVDTLEKVDGARDDYYWVARGKADWVADPGTDVWAIRNKRISITPLHVQLTSELTAPLLAELAPTLFQAFQG